MSGAELITTIAGVRYYEHPNGQRFAQSDGVPRAAVDDEWLAGRTVFPRAAGLRCYQCMETVNWRAPDGRGACCTQMTVKEVTG